MTVDLPARLDLPLSSGRPYWYFLGGRHCLNLVNTLRERWNRNVETLASPEDLSAWLVRAAVTAHEVDAVDGDLANARELREATDDLVVSTLAHGTPDRDVVAIIDGWAARAPRAALAIDAGLPVRVERGPEREVDDALARIALDAIELLGTEQRRRVRICASDTCSARFFDASNAGRRRWCSMAECGNRAKARRHRAGATRQGVRHEQDELRPGGRRRLRDRDRRAGS